MRAIAVCISTFLVRHQGAAFDQAKVLACVAAGRRLLPPEEGRKYRAFVDMSGGSSDDAVIAIAHQEGRVVVVDRIEKQSGRPPFNPRNAVSHFVTLLKDYGVARVHGDSFAGNTFRSDFEAQGVAYVSVSKSKSDMYELLEAPLNAGEIELLDQPTLIEQATCLVWRGQRIDHEAGGHDDHINAVAGVAHALRGGVFDDVPLCWPQFIPKVGDRWSGAWDGGHIAHGPEYSGLGGAGVYRERGW